MVTFAELYMEPGGILAWVIVGILAGWLAGVVMKGGGYGIVVDMIVGLIGALIGGELFGSLVVGNSGFVGSIFVAFIGACILIAVLRAVAPRRTNL